MTDQDIRDALDPLWRAREGLDTMAVELALGRLRDRLGKIDELRVSPQVAEEIRQATTDAIAGLEKVLAVQRQHLRRRRDDA